MTNRCPPPGPRSGPAVSISHRVFQQCRRVTGQAARSSINLYSMLTPAFEFSGKRTSAAPDAESLKDSPAGAPQSPESRFDLKGRDGRCASILHRREARLAEPCAPQSSGPLYSRHSWRRASHAETRASFESEWFYSVMPALPVWMTTRSVPVAWKPPL